MISKYAAEKFLLFGDLLPVLSATSGPCVSASQERSPAWSADGALAVGSGKGHPITDEPIRMRGFDSVVA